MKKNTREIRYPVLSSQDCIKGFSGGVIVDDPIGYYPHALGESHCLKTNQTRWFDEVIRKRAYDEKIKPIKISSRLHEGV